MVSFVHRCFLPALFAVVGPALWAQFGPAQLIQPFGAGPQLQAVDWDGDDDLDLIGLFSGAHLRWFENQDGLGGLASGQTLTTLAGTPQLFTLADLDFDGLPDLLHVNNDGSFLKWSRNLGNGSMTPAGVVIPLNEPVLALACADVLGDGNADVLLLSQSADGPALHYLPNNGGSFGAATAIPISFPQGLAPILLVGDLDLTGGNDVVLVDAFGDVHVLRNLMGDASQWETATILTGQLYPFTAAHLRDVDGDGDLDLAEATGTVVQWAENRTEENNDLPPFREHVLEPWTSAGVGAFGNMGCTGTAVLFVPSDPGLPVAWRNHLQVLEGFSYSNNAGVARGVNPLLTDLNGDGRDDLVIGRPNGTFLHLNTVVPPTTVLQPPGFDTLCVFGPPVALPPMEPAGGRWEGLWVIEGLLYRANVGAGGSHRVTHTVYEDQGCPVALAAAVPLIMGPAVEPVLPGNILCSGDAPVQFTSRPVNTTWYGLEPGNVLDPATYGGGIVVCEYVDPSGAGCVRFVGPITVYSTLPAGIAPLPPLCVDAGVQAVHAAQAPPNGQGVSWSGDIAGYSGSMAFFDPSQGAGEYTVVLHVSPTGPQQCANSDTLTVVVSDEFPAVSLPALGTWCADGAAIELPGAIPAGGAWSGPGVSDGVLTPAAAGPGTHTLTYAYTAPNGCTGSGTGSVLLADEALVTVPGGDLTICKSDPPVQLEAWPQGGAWSEPVNGSGLFDPAALPPGSYTVTYTWTGPNGCTLTDASTELQVWLVTDVTIGPVPTLCLDGAPHPVTASHPGTWSGAASGEGSTVLVNPALLGAGTWLLTIVAEENGQCPGTASIPVVVESCTGTDEPAASVDARVVPNPFGASAQVWIQGAGWAVADVLDASGRLVFTRTVALHGLTVVPLAFDGLAPGAYTVRIALANGTVRRLQAVKAE